MELIQDLTRGLLTVNKYLFNYAIKYVRDQSKIIHLVVKKEKQMQT